MKEYVFHLKHDAGTVAIRTTGSSYEIARRKVLDAEGAPPSAIQYVTLPEFESVKFHPYNGRFVAGEEITLFSYRNSRLGYGMNPEGVFLLLDCNRDTWEPRRVMLKGTADQVKTAFNNTKEYRSR